MRTNEIQSEIARIEKEAEERSPFRFGQLVSACIPQGLKIGIGTIEEMPHDHADPKQHFDTRVIGWDCLGRIMVASPYGGDPHCCRVSYGDDHLAPREGDDWTTNSRYKRNDEIAYAWDIPRSFPWEDREIGEKVLAIIVAAHIKPGDWIVRYPNSSGEWIPRVLNETMMLER